MYQLVRTQLYLESVHGVLYYQLHVSAFTLAIIVKRDLSSPPTPEHTIQIV
jgi:hypothetical protein